MGKRLVAAPAGAGKTDFALKLALKTASSLRNEVRVCVPNALQARVWRERLAAAGGAIGIHVLTFDELVAVCLAEAGESYIELSDAVQNRLIRSLFSRLTLQHYAPLKDKPGFVQVNKRIIGELKAGSIDPRPFAGAVRELEDALRLVELADIYSAYQKELIGRKWADRAGLQWLAAEALRNHAPNLCLDWPLLIIDGFDDLAPSQMALLKLLGDRVQEFVITLTSAERAHYPRYERLQLLVEKELVVNAEALTGAAQEATIPPLKHLARHLFALPAVDPIANDGTLLLRETGDQASEVRTALRWLKQRIVWEGMSPGDVALLAREMTPYQPYISEIAAEFGLPIRLLDGQPLQQNPAVAALLDLLRLYLPTRRENQPALPRSGVVAAWRSPYFAWGAGDLAITAADADALDIFSRQQRIISGRDQWERAFLLVLAADEPVEAGEDIESAGTISGLILENLQEKFVLFLDLSKPFSGKSTVRQFVAWLKTLMGRDPGEEGANAPLPGSLNMLLRAGENRERPLPT